MEKQRSQNSSAKPGKGAFILRVIIAVTVVVLLRFALSELFREKSDYQVDRDFDASEYAIDGDAIVDDVFGDGEDGEIYPEEDVIEE